MKRNEVQKKLDKVAGLLILLSFGLIATLLIAGYCYGFRFKTGREVLVYFSAAMVLAFVTAYAVQLAKDYENEEEGD